MQNSPLCGLKSPISCQCMQIQRSTLYMVFTYMIQTLLRYSDNLIEHTHSVLYLCVKPSFTSYLYSHVCLRSIPLIQVCRSCLTFLASPFSLQQVSLLLFIDIHVYEFQVVNRTLHIAKMYIVSSNTVHTTELSGKGKNNPTQSIIRHFE